MPDKDWPPRCRHCNAPVGLRELAGVIDGEGFVVAATTMELRADPRRYRGRVLHLACAAASGLAKTRARSEPLPVRAS